MTKLQWMWLTILITLGLSEASKILVIFPFPGKSHGILGYGFVKILLDAGHDISYITPFPVKDSNPKLHQIDVSANNGFFGTSTDSKLNISAMLDGTAPSMNVHNFLGIILNLAKQTINNDNVMKMLQDPKQEFDLIIAEWMFSDLYCGLSALYGCPFVWFSSVEPHWVVLSLIDEALSPAYNPNTLSSNIPPFSFIQRVQELSQQIVLLLFQNFYFSPYETEEYNKIFKPLLEKRGKPLVSYDDVKYNTSLMFGNSHVALGQATRLPQSYKPIAGYHIDPVVKPLPEDLQKLMDSAKNGVIYFSFGSNVESKDLPEVLQQSLLKMFGELKYTVIWKFEADLPNRPKNVHILKWAPQPSILAHPNCILFITHGGLLSATETVHFGVPIIGVPLMADQHINVDRAVQKGFAKRVTLSYNLVEDLKSSIEEILSNPKYREKVKELSFVYHDRPVTPAQEVAHWANHVIRTKGAPHLRSPALLVPWYQKMYLDLALLVIALYYLLKVVVKRLCCSNKKTRQTKKNN